MNTAPSILTRRGFLRTMGLIVGAVVVAPAALAAPAVLVGRRQYDPSKVEVCIGGERIRSFTTADRTSWDFIEELVTFPSTAHGDQSDAVTYEILGGELFSTSWNAVDADPIADIENMIRKIRIDAGLPAK